MKGPKIDPNILSSSWGSPKGTPNFRKPPYHHLAVVMSAEVHHGRDRGKPRLRKKFFLLRVPFSGLLLRNLN